MLRSQISVNLLLNATTRRNANGDPVGVVMVGQNITEMLKAQREATQVAEEMMQLIDTANAPIFGVDAHMQVNESKQSVALRQHEKSRNDDDVSLHARCCKIRQI